jgi:hypothetical protein
MDLGVFLSITLRLATGVPIDIPYWFDLDETEIKSYGITLARKIYLGKRYLYPPDDGKQSIGLFKCNGRSLFSRNATDQPFSSHD